MSRFIDKLKKASQAEAQPMGFRKEKVFSKQRLVLVARLSRNDIDIPSGHLNGADAGLLAVKQDSEIKTVKEVVRSIKDIPWGMMLESASLGGIKQAVEVGCDFIVFPPEMPLEVIDDKGFGKVLLLEASLEVSLLKALDELPVDAIIITGEQAKGVALTWRHLMLFRRFAGISNKPLLVPVPSDITGDGLQAIWEAGVSGVIVETAAEQPADEFKKLSRVIDSLAPPLKRRRTKMRAIVPKLREETAPIADEEEEEEEDSL